MLRRKQRRPAFDRRSHIDLVADTIDAETGKWLSRRATIGPPSDSYYEYLYGGCAPFWRYGFQALVRCPRRCDAEIPGRATRRAALVHTGRFRDWRAIDRHQSEFAAFMQACWRRPVTWNMPRLSQLWADVQTRFAVLPEGSTTDPSPRRAQAMSAPGIRRFLPRAFRTWCRRLDAPSCAHPLRKYEADSRARFGYTIIDDVTATQ